MKEKQKNYYNDDFHTPEIPNDFEQDSIKSKKSKKSRKRSMFSYLILSGLLIFIIQNRPEFSESFVGKIYYSIFSDSEVQTGVDSDNGITQIVDLYKNGISPELVKEFLAISPEIKASEIQQLVRAGLRPSTIDEYRKEIPSISIPEIQQLVRQGIRPTKAAGYKEILSRNNTLEGQ